jgi:hypothetical protein
MSWLFYSFYDYPALSLLQIGLTIWMLVDASRRHAEQYWFWLILLFQPIGPWAYFAMVKSRDFRHGISWPTFQRPAALDQLQYQADKVPTLASHLALANRLIDLGRHAEAMPHLEAALAREPDHCQVLYGLALCWQAQGQPAKAIPYLERIVQRDRHWSDFAAMRMLVEMQASTEAHDTALTTARELARISPRLQHQCLLAEELLSMNLSDEAGQVLQQALETHHYTPGPNRWRNRGWARQARQLQRQVASKRI